MNEPTGRNMEPGLDPGMLRRLKRRIRGDVLGDEMHRLLYSTAGGIFQIMPSAVVVPRDREDVVRTVQFCREHAIPVTARGAGSGVAGQTLGRGIILDFSKYLDDILEVNQVQSWVRVQPGVVLGELNRHLARYGLWFPPDPSSGEVATLGGMIANNAAGAHTIKYGATRDYLLETEVVLDSGETVRFKPEDRTVVPDGRYGAIFPAMADLLKKNADLLKRTRPVAPKNSSGYWLWDVEREGKVDLNRLLAGSEGTLGIVTEAKLRVIRKPAERSLVAFLFATPDAACAAVPAVNELKPAAVELVDKSILDLVKGTEIEEKHRLPKKVQSILLTEFDGPSRDAVVRLAEEAVRKVEAVETRTAFGSDFDSLWKIRKLASPILDRMQAKVRSTRVIEDVCVDPSRLADYISGLRKIFRKHKTPGIIFGHAGSGHVHVNLLMNPEGEDDHRRLEEISSEVADLTADLKGTLSGEHGDGILRAPYLRRTYPEIYPLFEQVKAIFDPKGILNPEKILVPEGFDFRKYLRGCRRPDRTLKESGAFLDWKYEADRCNGCGTCRTYCPVYLEVPDESATPRAKANLVTGLNEGKIPLESILPVGELRRVADRCINCKLCLIRCPVRVDIPGMCLEAKAVDTMRRGLSKRDAMFAKARESSDRAAKWAPFSNWMLSNPLFRLGLRWFRGIAAGRKFPRFGFDRTVSLHKEDAPRVVYFPGCAADTTDPAGERRAAVEILERNGFEVLIPEGLCCGLAAHSLGDRPKAREEALRLVQAVAAWVDEGLTIVTSSSSCGGMIRKEYDRLLDTDRARRTAAATVDIHEFLWKLHREGKLDVGFKRINATCILHASCHMQAEGTDAAAKKLLDLIPDLQRVPLETGCCGMGGSFGFKAEHYDVSMAIGHRMTSEMRRLNPTFLVTSNGNCRPQLEQGARRPVIHTMTLLHTAYGLSPLKGVHTEHEGLAVQTMVNYMGKGGGGGS